VISLWQSTVEREIGTYSILSSMREESYSREQSLHCIAVALGET
jgi:hypothetical protein